MSRRGRTRTAEIIDILLRVSVERLCQDANLAEDAARVIMREALHSVCEKYGGDSFYFPRDIDFPLEARDREIWDKFNGANTRELAREFRLTERQVRYIVKLMRKRATELNQLEIPGLDAATH